jgi:hypothetical protein
MSIGRSPRIDQFTAQRLLRGETADPDRLAELLATAAAPAARGELAGEEAAVAAFREAHLGPVVQLRRQSVIKTALAKLLTLKVAAAALTVTAAGGVALAAGTGNLPQALGGAASSSHPTPTRDAKAQHTPKDTAAHDGHSASPSPSLVGLCHAYQAGVGDSPGKALGNPAFTHLITVAGGKDAVAAYCTNLLKTHPGSAHASHPAGAHAKRPTSAPAQHPTSAPSTHPTGAPTSHPTRSTHPVH